LRRPDNWKPEPYVISRTGKAPSKEATIGGEFPESLFGA